MHHVVCLDAEDTLRILYENMKALKCEENWWQGVSKIISSYKITLSENDIRKTSKNAFKKIVSRAITKVALRELREECQGKSKDQQIGIQWELKST